MVVVVVVVVVVAVVVVAGTTIISKVQILKKPSVLYKEHDGRYSLYKNQTSKVKMKHIH